MKGNKVTPHHSRGSSDAPMKSTHDEEVFGANDRTMDQSADDMMTTGTKKVGLKDQMNVS